VAVGFFATLRLVTVSLVAAAGAGCVASANTDSAGVANATLPQEAPVVSATAENGFGLVGCWEWSKRRPGTPLGYSSLTYCFGPGGHGSYTAIDYADGWEANFKYVASSDGTLLLKSPDEGEGGGRTCRFSLSSQTLKVAGCIGDREFKNECRDVDVSSDGYVSCRRGEQKV
jgi:hypothetical protein